MGTQHEGPGTAQLELATEELLLHALLHRRPQPGLPFYPAGRPGWPEFNLQTTVPPGPTLALLRSGGCFQRTALCLDSPPQGVFTALPFSNAHKVIIPSLHTSSLKGRLHFISVA